MFKRMFFVSILLITGILFWSYIKLNKSNNQEQVPVSSILGVEEDKFPQVVAVDGVSYGLYWHNPDVEKLILIPNYEEKLTADEIIEQKGCEFIINGGFYDENRKPLGLVIADSSQIAEYRENSLFNGIFSINRFLTPRITSYIPQDSLVMAIQSGPVLFKNGAETNILAENDKNARRSVVAVTGENELIFIYFTGINNLYYGPTLKQLPSLISELNKKFNLNIADALNLDGGSASLYVSDDTRIKEISLPGAYFCEQ